MNLNFLIKYSLILIAVTTLLLLPDAIFFEDAYPLCIHRKVLGVECPLCGMTRAAHEFMFLNIRDAISYNFNIIFLPFYLVSDLLLITRKKAVYFNLQKLTVIFLIAGLIVIYAIRIIEYFIHLR